MNSSHAHARIAILGAGLIGKRHAEYVAGEAILSAIVDPAEEAKAVAQKHSVNHYSSLDDLLNDDKPDGVIIATPNQMHEEHAIKCMEAGIPVLIEKPIADTVAAAERIVAVGEKTKVPILVGHHRRYNPLIARAKQAIDEGKLGRIVAVHTSCWFYKPDDYFTAEWRRASGAGPILVNMIHDVDLLRYFCGDVHSVQAQQSNAVRGHVVEDTAVILLKFTNGALGTVTVSDSIAAPWSWELAAAENPAYPVTGTTSTMIGGTIGSLSVPDLGLWQHDDAPSWWNPISRNALNYDEGDPLSLQIRHFADVIAGNTEPVMSGHEGLATLKVMGAINEAAHTGACINIA
ncbi:MAG: Gfo/Idh/MocA family oxidoreductase [Rhizobiaceae bacterium]|nr:Gfo/Idh/MocA family oxidoreductase [Rhizobiaceae bacterium]